MDLRWTSLVERLRGSLFFVPSLFVAGSVALAVAMIAVDDLVAAEGGSMPFFLASTVDSARAMLSTIATATITAAGIAFSVNLLVIQQASSQYSPRVVHGLFRDPVNKRVMGFVVGTFTYCLVVLQSVRGALSDSGEDVVPNIAVAVALVLGVASILAIVAFISHNAHTMEVSEVLQGVTEDTIVAFETHWPLPSDAPPPLPTPVLDTEGFGINFDDTGWVQHLDLEALGALAEPGGVIRLETDVGRYAIGGVRLCTIWPRPSDPESIVTAARDAVSLGRTRTLSQDPAYGIRQIADVGIRALSSGVDDPTTAQDAIFHLTAILRTAQLRVPPPAVLVDDDDRCLVRSERLDHRGIVELAFEELRRSAATHPTVSVYLLEALSLLCRSDEPPPTDDAEIAMREQAELVLAASEHVGLLPADLTLVCEAYEARFTGG